MWSPIVAFTFRAAAFTFLSGRPLILPIKYPTYPHRVHFLSDSQCFLKTVRMEIGRMQWDGGNIFKQLLSPHFILSILSNM